MHETGLVQGVRKVLIQFVINLYDKLYQDFTNTLYFIFRYSIPPEEPTKAKQAVVQWFLTFYIQLPTLQSDINKLPTSDITSH